MPKKRTLRSLSKELLDTPFFPLLFLSEAVKIGVLNGLTHDMLLMTVLSVVSIVVWVLSDAITVDVQDVVGEDEG